MPIHRRTTPRAGNFSWHTLSYIDRASLEEAKPGKYSLSGGPRPGDRIQNDDDLAAAWQQNRERFLILQESPRQRLAWSHRPGERPPLFWRFDAPTQPRDGEYERDALVRMGMMNEREAKALAHWDASGTHPGLGQWHESGFIELKISDLMAANWQKYSQQQKETE
jgi:hypothetical protein